MREPIRYGVAVFGKQRRQKLTRLNLQAAKATFQEGLAAHAAGDLMRAEALLREAAEACRKGEQPYSAALVLVELSKVYEGQDRPRDVSAALAAASEDAGRAWHHFGSVVRHLPDDPQSEERAMLEKHLHDTLDLRAEILRREILCLGLLGQHREAQEELEKALRGYLTAYRPESLEVARLFYALARVHARLGNDEFACETTALALSAREDRLGPQNPQLSRDHLEIADILLVAGHEEEACLHGAKAYVLRQPSGGASFDEAIEVAGVAAYAAFVAEELDLATSIFEPMLRPLLERARFTTVSEALVLYVVGMEMSRTDPRNGAQILVGCIEFLLGDAAPTDDLAIRLMIDLAEWHEEHSRDYAWSARIRATATARALSRFGPSNHILARLEARS